MKLRILAVGRARSGPESALIAEYQKRLHWPLVIEEVEERRPVGGAQLKAREAALLQAAIEKVLEAVPKGATVVALDERGASLTSPQFAEKLSRWQDGGVADVAFLLGGADGHPDQVRKRAEMTLSLGAMTWPHLLARSLLLEQLYRSQQIIAGHPYHRV